jgi:hypothetical protein
VAIVAKLLSHHYFALGKMYDCAATSACRIEMTGKTQTSQSKTIDAARATASVAKNWSRFSFS